MTVDIHRESFKEEARELLAELESSLLELEENPGDTELISKIFRAMHTIKGSGSMFGFDSVSKFTHELETAFDMVRKGKARVTKELINLTLKGRDHIRALMASYDDGGQSVGESETLELVSLLKAIVGDDSQTQSAAQQTTAPSEAVSHAAVTYRIRFRPSRDIFMLGNKPEYILDDIAALGDCKIVAHTTDVPLIDEMNPEACYVYWDIILSTDKGLDAIRDIFIFVETGAELSITVIDEGGKLDDEASYKRIGEILLEKGDINAEDLQSILATQKPVGVLLVDSGLVAPEHLESALIEQQHVREIREKRQVAESSSSIRVASEKLDALVNLVGELVTVHARLVQAVSGLDNPIMTVIAEDNERLISDLRDNTMSIRMLPIGTTFSRFKRLVRDLSSELGKDINLTTDGAETELDKTVIDQLNDPMVHLIRNSIDHGIEMPEMRARVGKSASGTINLSAMHSGASVVIRISDDGAGIDKDAIRAKAIERGMVKPDAKLTDKETYAMIFAAGFSTARKVTNVSGRGVGMDVVRRAIEGLRGSIEVESKKGVGSTITIQLPLTLAIIEGFLVKVGAEHYVIPLSMVSECMELTREHLLSAHGRNIVNVRGKIVPYIRLRDRFCMNGAGRPEIEHMIITESGGMRVGFVADQIIGQHQTVIKTLGKSVGDVDGISGATIMGDGTVALILDVIKLVSSVEAEAAAEMRA